MRHGLDLYLHVEYLHVEMSKVSHVTHVLKKESQAAGEGIFLLPLLRERRSSFHDVVEE